MEAKLVLHTIMEEKGLMPTSTGRATYKQRWSNGNKILAKYLFTPIHEWQKNRKLLSGVLFGRIKHEKEPLKKVDLEPVCFLGF
jgi:hypothetical protein